MSEWGREHIRPKPRREGGRGKPVQAYLDTPDRPRLRAEFENYLKRYGVTQTHVIRWLVAYVVDQDIEPPPEEQ